ncbi:MAG TPA: ankyrin repeat domain-containing protein [Sphingomicrobium sp.]|nr:ankyrin repeat domain-containing protein [Sphingomicrobium sp.]
MKVSKLAAAMAAAMMLVAAQGPSLGESGEAFVRAVREKNGAKVEELLQNSSPTLINARDVNGDSALMVAVSRRDDTWTGFLLSNGADPNLANRKGDTPLIAAARIGYLQGAEWLLARRARVDDANRMGETALIVAVQARQPQLVKYLLGKGANPDKTDNAAGYSARDYARRDNRNPELLRLIESAKKPAAAPRN